MIIEKGNKLKNAKVAIILLLFLFIVLIVSITIISALSNNSAVEIPKSMSSYSDKIDLSKVELNVKNHLKYVYHYDEDEIEELKIIIRDESLAYELDDNGEKNSAKFLIDLNNPRLTFLVNYILSSDTIFLDCPSSELVQDENIFCIGSYGQNTIDANLSKYLPYRGMTSGGVEFSIWHKENNSYSEPRLEILGFTCENKEVEQDIEVAVKEWIKSKGISNPEIIPLNITYSHCSHGE